MYLTWLASWCEVDEEEVVRARMKELAYVSRYGRVPPSEAARYPRSRLLAFCEAVDELLGEESKRGPSTED